MNDKPKLATDVPDPPRVTPEDIKRIKEEGRTWAADIKRRAGSMNVNAPRHQLVTDPSSELKKRGTCVVCKGDVVQKITYQYRGTGGPRRVGFDAKQVELRSPYNTNTIYGNHYCANCGLRYEFPPSGDDTPPPG
jgi:hypothetical protein